MKKLFIYSLTLLSSLSFYACSDDDGTEGGASDRLFRPMFRKDDNTGKGDADTYNCTVFDINSAHLYWYLVKDAAGYEIKWSLSSYVTGGKQAWEDTENGLDGKSLAGDTIIADPTQYDLVIPNLNYQTAYRFAIRALHSLDKNDPKNSDWYGYGDGRQWAEYLGLEMNARYAVPSIIQVSNITKTSMRINLNRKVDVASADYDVYKEHFAQTTDGNGNAVWKVDYLTVKASSSTPSATVDAAFAKYILTDEDWDRGYIDVTGLSQNGVYNIDVWDGDIKISVDANYNPLMKRTKGDPGAPIVIKHVANLTDTTGIGTANEAVHDISNYQAMKLDYIVSDYCKSLEMAENQRYYLEGGKAYFFGNSPSIYKGMTLETNPEDLAAGKPKAKLYMNGLTKSGTTVNTSNYMLGRQPESGENSAIAIDIDSIIFRNLDVDCPLAGNYGTQQEGTATSCGNYFMNMYSNGMGINVTLLEWDGCSFQGMVRGFFRIQGSNDFNIHELNIKNCAFYNCGNYDLKGAGYQWIFADHNGKPKSNILENVNIYENVWYNSPHGSLITDNNRNLTWESDVRWNFDIHHNTFVNFMPTSGNSPILNTRYVPGGSNLAFHDNLIIMTRDDEDKIRPMGCYGWDVRFIQGGDGTGTCTFDIYNNWSTNNNLNSDQVFTSNAFNANKNAPGATAWLSTCYYPHGTGNATHILDGEGTVIDAEAKNELVCHVDDISAVDLMLSPNPQYMYTGVSGNDWKTPNGIEGLYYKGSEAVKNSNIYKLGIGASMLRR